MTPREQLLHEIENAPDFLLEEVLDFLLFTKNRRQGSPSNDSIQTSNQDQPPIWESFEEFAEQLPEDISATLPTDGAAQIDHYLYGSPKHD
jgi:hypothetical protein